MKILHMISFALLIIGGLNWGLVGALNLDLVMKVTGILGGAGPMIAKIIYVLVGLSAIYLAVTHKQTCKYCMGGMGSSMGGTM